MASHDRGRRANPARENGRRVAYRAGLRARAIAKFGSKCGHCGFDDPRALQIDHVNDDGFLERAKVKSRVAFFSTVLRDTTGRYQLLCANCNVIKQFNRCTTSVTRDMVGGRPS
jgi:hypothetical protein